MKSYRPTARRRLLLSCVAVLCVNIWTASIFAADEVVDPTSDPPSKEALQFFESKVRPLLAEHCWSCHSGEKHKGGLQLDSRTGVLLGGETGEAIVVGDPDGSLLMEAVRYESYQMPPSGQLKPEQIQILETWIKLGAPWPGADDTPPVRAERGPAFSEEDRNWWAFQPVADPDFPHIAVESEAWAQNGIDHFILAKQQDHNLTPAEEADRLTLIRRLSFDLTGLPPSPEEIDEFLGDPAADAYEKLVDRYLESPRYGERWARHWLDLVRYADSDGYRADFYRPHAWRYRDFVIESLNEDKPYDRFVQEQLAGDELFPGNPEALIATGYLTHGIYEYNSRDAVGQQDLLLTDITDTTGDVFLGMGMQCARCHDHKFDPILQKDYFRLRAFFEPMRFLPDAVAATATQRAAYDEALQEWRRQTADIREELDRLEAPYHVKAATVAIERFPLNVQAMVYKPDNKQSARERQIADLVWRQVEYEFSRLDELFEDKDKERILELRRDLAKWDHLKPEPLPSAQAVTDVINTPPATVIPKKNITVQPGVLTLLQEEPLAVSPPEQTGTTGRRAALAMWLTDSENPLTARVIVNRLWQYHFGRGLAPNASDFGHLGGTPSHPELLDWLTSRFLESGWRLKPLHRLIVTSATYRQSTSHACFSDYMLQDPTNQWYWRGETQRLDAEQIRDAIFAVTGQLDLNAGGPGVQPDQPRRSVYTRSMRNARDPLLEAFDLPLFFTSSASRDTTTSPIQSLLLINSQTMLRHATDLAGAIISRESGLSLDDPEAAVCALWQRALGRQPTDAEIEQAVSFLVSQTEQLRSGRPTANPTSLPTAAMPYRDGQSVMFTADEPLPLFVASQPSLDCGDFTVEACFQIRSVYESGSVRTIVSKWNGDRAERGWSLGVTGKGSRRKPQTLVMQLLGTKKNDQFGEAVIFSDQHVALNTPYYLAATVKLAKEGPGEITFLLKNLSNDDEPVSIVTMEHQIRGNLHNDLPLSLGRTFDEKNGLFDGLIDDVRLTARCLEQTELLLSGEKPIEEIVGHWQFESSPGIFQDCSGNGMHIEASAALFGRRDPRWIAFVDLCHVLLNSNEFLYVH